MNTEQGQKGIRERKPIKTRLENRLAFFLMLFLSFLFIIGVGRVAYYKIRYGQEYEKQAVLNQVNKVLDKVINPNRGTITDRNNQALAVSTTVYNIYLDIRVLDTLDDDVKANTVNGLNKVLNIPTEQIWSYLEKDGNGNLKNDSNWFKIKEEVDYQLGKTLENEGLKCVYLEEDTKRTYPNGNLASQTIGFVRDSMWGIEAQYNEYLTGTPGRIFRTYEDDDNVITSQQAPIEGDKIITTIDQSIQKFAQEAAEKAYKEFEPENAAVLVMNPKTGEVLAMADYPGVDLNNPEELELLENETYKKTYDAMAEEERLKILNKAWRNFLITDSFEPGSIYKPMVVAAALEEGVITENDVYYCGGSKTINGSHISCHKKSGHGSQDVEHVIANSCNVGMMDIIAKLGREKYYKYQCDFGIGEKTGIDLPGEQSYSSLVYPLDRLNSVELATCSFGQGFNVTPIQVLTAFSSLINGGEMVKPYVVSRIIDTDGNTVYERNKEVVRKVISQETSDKMREMMQSVVTSEGTGWKGVIEGYAIGGKTGTAQQGNRDLGIHTVSYIAYLPVDNPDIVAMSVIHRPKEYIDGVTSPVPMLKEVLIDIINYKGIAPSTSVSDEKISNKNSNEIILNDYTNMDLKSAIEQLSSLGVDYEIVGSGGDTVTKQLPSANTKVSKGTKIMLYVSTSDGDKEYIVVPEVVGMTGSEAKTTLESVGFVCEVEEETSEESEQTTGENNNEEKKVYEQMPASQIKVEKGTLVKIKLR